MTVKIDKGEAQSIGVQVCLCLCCFLAFNFLRGRFPPTPMTMAAAFGCCLLSCSQMFALKTTVQRALEPEPEG
jgi:hypothetical protein